LDVLHQIGTIERNHMKTLFVLMQLDTLDNLIFLRYIYGHRSKNLTT